MRAESQPDKHLTNMDQKKWNALQPGYTVSPISLNHKLLLIKTGVLQMDFFLHRLNSQIWPTSSSLFPRPRSSVSFSHQLEIIFIIIIFAHYSTHLDMVRQCPYNGPPLTPMQCSHLDTTRRGKTS